MYVDYDLFINEGKYEVYRIFDFFYDKIIKFLEDNIDKKITDFFFYNKAGNARTYLMNMEDLLKYNKSSIDYILTDDKFYKEIMLNSKIGIRLTPKSASASFFKEKEYGIEKYCIVICIKIPNTYEDIHTAVGIKKFKKTNNTIKYLLDLYKDPSIKKSLLHEFVHMVDTIKIKFKHNKSYPRIGYKNTNLGKKTISDKSDVRAKDRVVKDFKAYANSTHEINAHILPALYQAKEFLNTGFENFKQKVFDNLGDAFKRNIKNSTKKTLLKVIYDYYTTNVN